MTFNQWEKRYKDLHGNIIYSFITAFVFFVNAFDSSNLLLSIINILGFSFFVINAMICQIVDIPNHELLKPKD